MNISVAITNHNQNTMVVDAIMSLLSQTVRPRHIIVVSDAAPFYLDGVEDVRILPVNNKPGRGGRCANRNSALEPFLKTGDDALVFIDGDCKATDKYFVENYAAMLSMHDLVFGCRRHTPVDGISKPASDLLTANMDTMWSGKPLDYTDLRVASGAVRAWQESDDFMSRVDLMLTGMIGWSCNFGITRDGLLRLMKFMRNNHGRTGEIFDSDAFSHGWGYEDVAMGIDAMYAGLDVWITESVLVSHQSHERSDGLFDHVKGRHMIMERYRALQAKMDKHIRNLEYLAIAVASFALGMTAFLIRGLI